MKKKSFLISAVFTTFFVTQVQAGCGANKTQESCESDEKCNWRGDRGYCTGEGTNWACSFVYSQKSCGETKDCSWVGYGYCYTKSDCNFSTKESCETQKECEWNERIPDPSCVALSGGASCKASTPESCKEKKDCFWDPRNYGGLCEIKADDE